MYYSMKQITERLNISIKTIRCYEKAGLITIQRKPSNIYSNEKCNGYRQFTEDDIDKIWKIKMLQGIGYSYKDINAIVKEGCLISLDKTLDNKINELENNLTELKKTIGYAKQIKLTGCVPEFNYELPPEQYTKENKEKWNINIDPFYEKTYEFLEVANKLSNNELNISTDDLEEIEIQFCSYMQEIADEIKENPSSLALKCIENIIIKCQEKYNYNSSTTQNYCKAYYYIKKTDEQTSLFKTKDIITDLYNRYNGGSIGAMARINYTNEQLSYLYNAISFCGGYKNYKDFKEKEEL